MAIPGWHLVRLTSEAQLELIGGVVDSIRFAPVSGRMLFTLGSRRGKRFLVIGVRGDEPALFWTESKSELAGYELFEPSERFNRLKGSRLASLDLPHADRLLRADFVRPDGTAPPAVSLWIGWIGKSGNIWLADSADGTVLETQWRTEAEIVGTVFAPPKPPSLLDWRTATFPDFLRERDAWPKDSLAEVARRRIWGVDRVMAETIGREFESQAGRSSNADPTQDRWREFSSVVGVLRRAVNPGTPVELISGELMNGEIGITLSGDNSPDNLSFPTLAAALAARQNSRRVQSEYESQLTRLRANLEKQLKRAQRRLDDTKRAIASAEQAEMFKQQADLLGAQRHLLRRGMFEVTVTDWKTGATITIPLDEKLSAQENIEALYRRARKTVRAAENASLAQAQLSAEVERLNSLRDELAGDGVSEERLTVISRELRLEERPAKAAKRVQTPRLPYREFLIGGFTVLVGRSNRENDEVTLHVARPDDLFLHANQVSGSHVILRSQERGSEFPLEIVRQAAQMAAYFSKARHSGLVSVVYTQVRHVSKPRKAPSGRVRVEREKSLMVRPLPPPGYHAGEGAE